MIPCWRAQGRGAGGVKYVQAHCRSQRMGRTLFAALGGLALLPIKHRARKCYWDNFPCRQSQLRHVFPYCLERGKLGPNRRNRNSVWWTSNEKSHRKILRGAGRHAMFWRSSRHRSGADNTRLLRRGLATPRRSERLAGVGDRVAVTDRARSCCRIAEAALEPFASLFAAPLIFLGAVYASFAGTESARKAGRDAGLALIPTVASKSKVYGVACLSRASG